MKTHANANATGVLTPMGHALSEDADLRAAWADQAQWRVLQTCFGRGLEFLTTWQAWRSDPHRPRLLHYLACDDGPASVADLAESAAAHPDLQALMAQLQAQWQGLLPGFHRLVFDEGRVLLTLGVGHAKSLLKEQLFEADTVYLGGGHAPQHPEQWDLHTLQAVARCCRRGSQLTSWRSDFAVKDGLQQCGFELHPARLQNADPSHLHASFNPRWTPKLAPERLQVQARTAARCVVVGAGLAGAACAASLARRGWQVTVLDMQASAAQGASGLPAGILAPHVSPDDSLLSRLSRSGLRATWQAAAQGLVTSDGQASGVLQRRFDDSGNLPKHWPAAGTPWSRLAQPDECAAAQLSDPTDAESALPAPLWHGAGGWLKPQQLVQSLLSTPGITQRYGVQVGVLKHSSTTLPLNGLTPCWQILDTNGQCLAEAELVVLAAGFDSAALLAQAHWSPAQPTNPDSGLKANDPELGAGPQLPLQAIRGQVAWGPTPHGARLPPFPVNGYGSFVPAFTLDNDETRQTDAAASCWLMGATFERNSTQPEIKNSDQHALLARLQKMLPSTAAGLENEFNEGRIRSWAGVRCASPDHLPMVGALDATHLPGLCVCTALGSRGLTFAVLCGELLAAWLHAEPLPIDKRLAHALRASRFF